VRDEQWRTVAYGRVWAGSPAPQARNPPQAWTPTASRRLWPSGGWISAFGGAWKDAPAEGFQPLKFFRSPALAALVATEAYKTFVFPSSPRGKFAGMPVRYPDMLHRRRHFLPVYVAIRGAILAAAIGAAYG
jgi:hypothetical protein